MREHLVKDKEPVDANKGVNRELIKRARHHIQDSEDMRLRLYMKLTQYQVVDKWIEDEITRLSQDAMQLKTQLVLPNE